MAAYREHISVSGLLGVGYGAAGHFLLGFTPVQSALAGVLTWVSGMLPDLDSQSGKPVREIFSLIAAAVPLACMGRLLKWGGGPEGAMLLAVAMYAAVRYGGSWVLGKLSVHRGMFHSVPAMAIAAELAFLGYASESYAVKFFIAGGVGLGFFSHLLLDEIYSVQWTGVRIKLKKSAGSAIKVFSRDVAPNAVTYGLLAALTYLSLIDLGWVQNPTTGPSASQPPATQQATEQPPTYR